MAYTNVKLRSYSHIGHMPKLFDWVLLFQIEFRTRIGISVRLRRVRRGGGGDPPPHFCFVCMFLISGHQQKYIFAGLYFFFFIKRYSL